MKEIEINISEGLPDGCFIFKIDDSNFKLYIPKEKLNQNINGKIKISGKCKTYPLFYGESENEDTQDYLLTYDSFGNISSICDIDIPTNTGKIKIKKVDAETRKSLEGVVFQLLDSNNKEIQKLSTDKNGELTFSNLYQGTYKLKEIKTNDNYILDVTENEIKVTYNQTVNKEITNNHKKANLKIYKVDKDNNKIALGNVKFDLFSEEFQKVIGTYTTNADGEIEIENLRVGNYKIIEKNTGKWYDLADSIDIKVNWNEVNEKFVENELKKGQLKIIKVDKDNNEIKLKDVKFNILDHSGKVLETIITDENGEAMTSRYPIRDYEQLTIQEIETNKAYKLNNNPQTITLKENEIQTVIFENEVKKGKIKVIKVDKDNNEVKLEGVEFELLNSKGELLENLITDKNGEAVTSSLPISEEYILIEKTTLENYKLDEQEKTIILEEDEIKTLKFENEKKKGKIKVIKVDKDNNEVKLKDVKFGIYNSDKKLIETLVTDENGEAISNRLSIDEEYYLKELETGKEYKLSEEEIKVELKEDEVTNIKFENEKIKNRFKIIKVDKDDNNIKLEDVKFEVFDEKSNLLETLITDKNGEAFSKYYPVVNRIYTIHELSSLENYKKLDEYISFELEKDKIIELKIDNEKIPEEPKEEKEEEKEEEKDDEKENKEDENVPEVKLLPRTGY